MAYSNGGYTINPSCHNDSEEEGMVKPYVIDLRSDTVTKPSPRMRKAMAEAEVGDDVFGGDPTVNKLQQLAAEMFGKEDAIFVPSGTQGNLIACLTHCQRGEEIILGDQSHIYLNEQGGCASLGGIFPRAVNTLSDATLPLSTIKEYIRGSDIHHPVTRMVALENTHNWCGGKVVDTTYVDSLGEYLKTFSRSHSHYKSRPLQLHMDGARIFNASVFLNEPVAKITKSVDSISVCLSKGLGAPVGSVLIGSADFIHTARRMRKVLGGGMRQAGVIAACGIMALTENVERLSEDHLNAKALANGIKDIKMIAVLPVETNLIFAEFKEEFFDSEKRNSDVLVQKLGKKGVLIGSITARKFRMVTHLHISTKDVEEVVKYMHEIFEEL